MKLRSKSNILKIFGINLAITVVILLVLFIFDIYWSSFDYKILDIYYKYIVEEGKGPQNSNRVVLVNISDDTYDYFDNNILDRADVARINNVLSDLSPEGIMYDIIFPRPSNRVSDSLLSKSISASDIFYLPSGFELSNDKHRFRWENTVYHDFMKSKYLKKIKQVGNGEPFYAKRSIVQYDSFALSTTKTGHISSIPDADGVYRRYPIIIKVDSLFFPTVTLSMFLDYNQIPFDSILIDWGEKITIPAIEGSYLEKDLLIPIDVHGNVFIPYPNFWGKGIKMIEVNDLLNYYDDPDYYDDLLEMIEGNFVFVGDISTGISDIGNTPLEENVPLVFIHATLMNSFLSQDYYDNWKIKEIFTLILVLTLLLFFVSIPKSNIPYISLLLLIVPLIFMFGYYQLLSFKLFPIFSVSASVFIAGVGTLLAIQILTQKEGAFIREAFSKYLPGNVVDELIRQPEKLQLGGEEREVSILFSDIAGFTTISESIPPKNLVKLLNEYLTEMTAIVLQQGGIIDKYIGDAILAEFGAPLQLDKHPDIAVKTALQMKKKLVDLNREWHGKNYPIIDCRIGINTGKVIIGNMGSNQVFDYTVIGDAVNLAARLESANKQYNTSIMISEFTYKLLSNDTFKIRPLDIIKVKGKNEAVKVYEVYGFFEDVLPQDIVEYYQNFEIAFNYYLERSFEKSKIHFEKALTNFENDPVSKIFLARIASLKAVELPDDWDGSTIMNEK